MRNDLIFNSLNPYSNGRYSRSFKSITVLMEMLKVLILILMEDTLGVLLRNMAQSMPQLVLILILMEDTLGAVQSKNERNQNLSVLILILMEDTLGGL